MDGNSNFQFTTVWNRIPRRIRVISLVFLTNLAIFLLLRAAFLFYFIPEDKAVFSSPVMKAFYLGFKFDARLAALLCLPILILSFIPFLDPVRNKIGRAVWIGYLVLTYAAGLFIYMGDFGTYSYIKNRVNATLFMLAGNPDISFKMVWESYPVVWIMLFYFTAVYLYWYWIRRKCLTAPKSPPPARVGSKWKKGAVYAGFFFILVLVIYGKAARFPLRWSEAFFSPDMFISQLGLNPILYLYKTFSTTPNDFDMEKVKQSYPVLADYYGIGEAERAKLSLKRSRSPEPVIKGAESPNIVVIILETFAAFKARAVVAGREAAPHFNRLSREGLYFSRFFVPMENTSRSLFAFMFGMPDVTPGRYSSWHPLLVDQRTVVNTFEGYGKYYFLGGSANWGNIRGVLKLNIDGLEIYEEGRYDSPVHDVWGISDADLFMEANQVIRTAGDAPFFAVIQTSGNHRPFKIPDDSKGFETIDADKKELKKKGFYSLAEYNGFRFLDHCLGYYFDLARREAYFDNTVFVVFGDHGTMGGAVDTRFGDLSFGSYHVPFVIYAPGLLPEPQKIETVMSELDVLPTLAGLLGAPYTTTTLGRNIFGPRFKDRMFAFTYTAFRSEPRLGLIQDEFYINVDPDDSFNLYRWAPGLPPEDMKTQHPQKAESMHAMARAIREYSRWLIFNNHAVRGASR